MCVTQGCTHYGVSRQERCDGHIPNSQEDQYAYLRTLWQETLHAREGTEPLPEPFQEPTETQRITTAIAESDLEPNSVEIVDKRHPSVTSVEHFENILHRHRAEWATQMSILAQRGGPDDVLIVNHLTSQLEQLLLSQKTLLQNLISPSDRGVGPFEVLTSAPTRVGNDGDPDYHPSLTIPPSFQEQSPTEISSFPNLFSVHPSGNFDESQESHQAYWFGSDRF